jgi:lipopolysaccharide transport protein LptA
VRLALEDAYEGSAQKLWIHPKNRLLHLRGEVELRGTDEASEGFHLKASNLLLDLNRNTVQADGAAILRRPGEIVRARRIVAFLAEETRVIRFVRARWDVWARLNRRGALADVDLGGGAEDGDDDGGSELSRVIVQCEDLGLLLGGEGQTARELEIQDGPRGVATLTAIDVGDTRRHVLEAPRITADLEDGRPVSAVAEGGVVLTAAGGDGEGAGAGQRATGDRATAAFDAEGALTSVELTGDVSLTQGSLEAIGQRGVFHVREDRGELTGGVVVTDEDLEATGERGTFEAGEDSGVLFGRPAVVTTSRGRMEAPEVRYSGAEGLVHGTGGVRARLDETEGSALAGSPLARGPNGEGGPVRVEAEEGFFRDRPRGFLFRGAVRAWRGDDLVVADELRGDEPAGRVVATGDVRTLFHPEASDEDDPDPEPAADGEGADLAHAPLEVEAEELVYRRQERLLVYTGDVTALQEGRRVTCREMVVELAESGGTGEVTCTGDVEVEEPVEGRTLMGHRAVYDPESRTILVTAAEGGKVTLRDRSGNELTGPQMRYDLETGEVRVTRPGGATPAPPAPPDGGAP